ncbi:MAG TPA: tRNA (adenosine(37)-N6)-threonylcarbamoyltransferase complex ATPase subunit type 1 TsaE [Bryobacteraceae bacterium]|nr:tRNA (adenosine(37)-N6)-threonylcarbamoyltransferase complex ATPase subunit type 1 TsaE [Bryobacteraceae bacterium]
MKSRIFHTESEEETIALGEKLATEFPAKAAVLLIGNLGAGKTTLAKGIVKGLGAADPAEVSSPTFTLIHEYSPGVHEYSPGVHEYSPGVYHIDLYRLETPAEAATLGLDEIFDRDAVVLIEWGEKFLPLMPEDRIEIRLRATGENSREIEVVEHQEAAFAS